MALFGFLILALILLIFTFYSLLFIYTIIRYDFSYKTMEIIFFIIFVLVTIFGWYQLIQHVPFTIAMK
jgi:hypothetical protein